jgi:FAS-associated factor 2
MADAALDLAQLTEDQQLALQQFIAVTDQAPKDAIPLLVRCQWNAQVCILSVPLYMFQNAHISRLQ